MCGEAGTSSGEAGGQPPATVVPLARGRSRLTVCFVVAFQEVELTGNQLVRVWESTQCVCVCVRALMCGVCACECVSICVWGGVCISVSVHVCGVCRTSQSQEQGPPQLTRLLTLRPMLPQSHSIFLNSDGFLPVFIFGFEKLLKISPTLLALLLDPPPPPPLGLESG